MAAKAVSMIRQAASFSQRLSGRSSLVAGHFKKMSKKLQYAAENMQKALEAVRSGCSQRLASRQFGVPRATLQDKLIGRSPEERRMGPNPVLTREEENKLEKWLIDLSKTGFPRKKDDLLDTVMKIVTEDGRPNPFINNRPSDTWYRNFLKRHPKISERTAETISKARALVNEANIRKWFKDLESFLQQKECTDLLSDGRRILNADETNFQMCPKSGKVLGPKGWKDVYEIAPGKEKETLTVLGTFNASGEVITGMIVYPYIRPPKDLVRTVPKNWAIGRSDTGWMKSETFYEYVANVLHPWLVENRVTLPVLFIVDGHKTHLTHQLSEFCSNNGIILYCLFPNATHILQPADVSVFRPLKLQWKKHVKSWQTENPGKSLSRKDFAPLLDRAMSGITTETISNGFKACGLFPFNPEAVDYNKCVDHRATVGASIVQSISISSPETSKSDDIPQRDVTFSKSNCQIAIALIQQLLTGHNRDLDAILATLKSKSDSLSGTSQPIDSQQSSHAIEDPTAQGIKGPMAQGNRNYAVPDNGKTGVEDHDDPLPEDDKEPPFQGIADPLLMDDIIGVQVTDNSDLDIPLGAIVTDLGLRINDLGELQDDLPTENALASGNEEDTTAQISTAANSHDIENKNTQVEDPAQTDVEQFLLQVSSGGGQSEAGQSSGVIVAQRESVSPAFEKHLFWPPKKTENKTNDTRKKIKKKMPYAVSSSEWRKMFEETEAETKRLEEEKKKRKDERQMKKTEKENQKAKKKSGNNKKRSEKKPGKKSLAPPVDRPTSDVRATLKDVVTNASGTAEKTTVASACGSAVTTGPALNSEFSPSSKRTITPGITNCSDPSFNTGAHVDTSNMECVPEFDNSDTMFVDVANPTSLSTLAAPGDQSVGKRKRTPDVQVVECQTERKRGRSDNNSLDAPCLYCNELFSLSKPGEQWVQCTGCHMWAHENCADISADGSFVCELCSYSDV